MVVRAPARSAGAGVLAMSWCSVAVPVLLAAVRAVLLGPLVLEHLVIGLALDQRGGAHHPCRCTSQRLGRQAGRLPA
eukprot:9942631-Lingulodinium_polyedra.AAC.1